MFPANKIITHSRVGAAIAFVGAFAFSLVLFAWPHRQSIFVYASLTGNVGTMKLLLALGVDVNGFEGEQASGLTPLIAAASANKLEAVELLLARGADVNLRLRRGQTALMFASYHGDTEMAKLLLSKGADPNADWLGDTALSWARQKGHPQIVSLLVASGATR